MKEKIKLVNQPGNEKPKNRMQCSEPELNGDFQGDIQVLQCVNPTSEIACGEESCEQEQNCKETLGSGLQHSMKSMFSTPLSQISTEPLNSRLPTHVGFFPSSQFIAEIGSGFLENTTSHDFCIPENHCSPPGFTQKLPVNLEQHVQNTLYFHQNSGAHSLAQQILRFSDAVALNISGTKSKSENGKEPIRSLTSGECQDVKSWQGELTQTTSMLGKNRKRRRTEDEPTKSPLQRKMEHLHKEKQRRLRQTKCYEILRNLVPSCDLKTDKANVLEATVAYLSYIKETLGSKMVIVEKGFLENIQSKTDFSN